MVEQIEDKYQKQLGKKMIHFLKYFPVRIKNVGMDAIMARKLIWNFKDGNDNAYEVVAEMTASKLVDEYGDEVKDMVLVCVPASSQSLNEKRFKLYCEKVSDLCSIHNGYEHIKILSSRAAVHEKNRKKDKSREEQTINVDADYFKGKDVVVMDDVVTTGLSYAKFADKLEEYGANVLGGLFLGRTSYKYV